MFQLGKINTLSALRRTSYGVYLGEDGKEDSILLPNKHVPESLEPGQSIDVFLYTDSEDRMVATTLQPKVMLGQFAVLEVNDITSFGAFLDWGLEKDLLLPFSEKIERVEIGDLVTVCLTLDDETQRLIASAKIHDFLEPQLTIKKGDEVDLLVDRKTDLGYQVLINDLHVGLVYSNEVFQVLHKGDRLKGYIKNIREDAKVDVSLQKQGYAQITDSQRQLIQKLKENNGVLFITDKSDPKLIAQKLQMSKKVFKKSVGALYKQRKIRIEDDRITLCHRN